MAKLYQKDTSKYADIDLDELLSKLTEEELEQLETELIDPDDPHIPPSERCRYKTDKKDTGPFNRKQLLDFIETKAKEEKDWEEAKPYKKEIRGKVWKPKEEEKIQINDEVVGETEWDEVLQQATEKELVDLAAILGFHGMLNQVQYHKAFVSGDKSDDEDDESGGGFRGIAKHQDFRLFTDEPPNDTDVDTVLQQLKDNDPKLKELNLNNMKNVSIERLCEVCKQLTTNTNLEKLHMANTRATEKVAKVLASSLADNKTLKLLNLESNYITGAGIVAMLESINTNQTLEELRVMNQKPALLGNRVEMHIAELVRQNKSLLRVGISLEVAAARIALEDYLKRNNDNRRRQRVGQEPIELPAPREPKWLTREYADRAVADALATGKNGAREEEEEESSEEESSDE